MQLSVDKIEDVVAVGVPVDELDASNASELKGVIAPMLQANARLVIDLTRVRFMDSSGLGAMLSCLRQLRDLNGDLKLCGMSEQVRGAFEVVRLDRIFDIYPDRAAALQAFRAATPQ
jgi:anti-sigma B factor antagonist